MMKNNIINNIDIYNDNNILDDARLNNICSICMNNININSDSTCITPCFHYFHYNCLHNWCEINTTCPNCRHDI